MQPDAPSDPEALKVQWLEDSLLVHALTMEGTSPRRDVHLLLVGACLSAGGVAAAVLAGSALAAALPATVWLGCAIGLGRRSWQVSHAAPPVARRLLVELRPGQLAWTLLAGDRWSMRHDHDLAVAEIACAVPAATPLGPVVQVRLRDGTPLEIPLYGLPFGDAGWLAARIDDLLAALADPA